ncbi:MAG: 16S rRNA processing protein RimM [uncultured Rubrobacteraceae bacterium]|uniref:Ribosome maturation factor RimM n=1 Tax=uncultured Rubrobacteraceae bacterium TaxID=349277 RepID=A0A6J4QGY8_9ACTN|nr:MAG: 16S rRNA processing protein RimM [uncultured Rubrobacteraceae bacterium]
MGELPSSDLADPVVIGVISAPHGVRGTVRVRSPGSGRHLRRGVEPVIDGERRRILASRQTPKGFLVDLEGIGDRDLAASLRGSELILDHDELDAPGEEEFYVGDLVGLEVYDEAGSRIGSVADILETPAHEILLVRDDAKEPTEHYVPFTHEHVPTVDLEGGRVVVDLPEVASE